MHGITSALNDAKPSSLANPKQIEDWTYANEVCRHIIISMLSNDLFDACCLYKDAKEIWDSTIMKYTAEDAGKQIFVIENY